MYGQGTLPTTHFGYIYSALLRFGVGLPAKTRTANFQSFSIFV